MDLANNYFRLKNELKPFPRARLVAVVKKREIAEIQTLIDAGAEIIAFNTVQDALTKLSELRFTGETHFIGRLQANKVRKAIGLFDVIESVESLELAERISEICIQEGKTQRVLLQINVAEDAKKAGFSITEFEKSAPLLAKLPNLTPCGLMTIGRFDANEGETRMTFQALRQLFEKYRASGIFGTDFTEVSMGMSGDYRIALEEGATLIRVGSALFAF